MVPCAKMGSSSACYALLVVCVNAAVAQFGRPQTPFNQARLSPQQQGHILSDIQQHQHRFNIQQNVLGHQQVFQPQQFGHRNKSPPSPAPTPSQFFPRNPSADFSASQSQRGNPQPAAPTLQSLNQQSNRNVQHHTQNGFSQNFQAIPTPTVLPQQFSQTYQLNPTAETLINLNPQQQQFENLDPEQQKQRLKELQEKQAIIEKHNQFVEKQYEKALKKAQSDHLDFVKQQQEQKKKLYQRLYRPTAHPKPRYSQPVPRYVFPEEVPLFKLSVEKYYEEHPTTTTTTTTQAPPTTTEEEAEDLDDPDPDTFLDSSRSEDFSQVKTATRQQSSKQPTFLPTIAPAKVKSIQSLEDLDLLKKQYKSQQIRKDELLAQLRQAIGDSVDDGRNLTSREISLANGAKAQIIKTSNPSFIPKGAEMEELVLANGQKVQVIKTTNPELIPGASSPFKTEEITLPDGRKAELIKTTNPQLFSGDSDLKTEEITLPDGRKAELIKTTNPNLFAGDSSFKTEEITLPDGRKAELIKTTDPKLVPGATRIEPGSKLEKLVFGSTTTTKPPTEIFEELTRDVVPAGTNFELLKHDSKGGLEQIEGLPSNLPDQKKVTFVLLEEQSDGTFKVQGVKGNGKDKAEVDVDSILKRIKNGEIKLPPPPSSTTERSTESDDDDEDDSYPSSSVRSVGESRDENIYNSVTISPNAYSAAASNVHSDTPVLRTNIGSNFVATTTPHPTTYNRDKYTSKNSQPSSRATTPAPANDLVRQASSASASNHNTLFPTNLALSQAKPVDPTPTPYVSSSVSPSTTESLVETTPQAQELIEVLRKNGLFAMARFLRQSGLDTILNETGPYTIFAPTDKAFKALLIQLGGPEKAEEKFKENPRLLSGLLLHHVIPGAFKIGSLQDEMTGVSLAGTQLRVNQYNMHDVEWNDVKITTINGAKVLEDKKDVEIPQGVAHAVDRVMFPLPVGDIVQTLQSDRERRFTSFLRALFASGLVESLQGTKTFTVFAPTDKAFASLPSEDLTRTVSDRVLARELVKKHIVPGTLYTNGMRYYQIRDSLEPNNQITLSKTLTKIKVNNVPISTSNIPATNGVIHAVDDLVLSQ